METSREAQKDKVKAATKKVGEDRTGLGGSGTQSYTGEEGMQGVEQMGGRT